MPVISGTSSAREPVANVNVISAAAVTASRLSLVAIAVSLSGYRHPRGGRVCFFILVSIWFPATAANGATGSAIPNREAA
ncbi:hypothetical protein CO2235_U840109 [Cupriavidus oxalaticus]|uniref:Uncharacterized protein n=1 Tax=Cupriavidus oxalaticus TaxID=96344 RepID=A0A375FVG5_9BURK|nr:hypothetical protein CO2235_U840109 [Cupriavidus oxalaticus]